MNYFKYISLSHKNASIELREKVSLNEEESRKLLHSFKEFFNLTETLIVSTCNRTEVYYVSEKDLSAEIIKMIAIEKAITDSKQLIEKFTIDNTHDTSVKHLFRVAMGLESQVVGDIQISNQVKNAYQWSADLEMAGPFLHRLMHSIFYTNKRTVQETSFRDGAASISYGAVELTEELTNNIKEPKILIVGVGEIGADVCRNFKNSNITNIKIANRTYQTSYELAIECGFEAVPFENLKEPVQEADLVISSLGIEGYFDLKKLKELNVLSHKFFIDLSVPRSVDPKVESIPGVLVYNIDALEEKASKALEKRIKAIPNVEHIIDESIAEFNNWSKEMEVSPTINKLKNALEDIRKREVSRYVKKLDEEELKLIDDVSKNLMQKIIKLPVLQLKAACQRGEAETLIDVLNDLFDLEKETGKTTINKISSSNLLSSFTQF